jgi:hypothetical protein
MKTRRQERISGPASLRADDQAPEFTHTAPDGQSVSLAAQLRRGPLILSFLDGPHPGDSRPALGSQPLAIARRRV